ncbi:unnamed protein product [Cyprideis torosa]|uniref:Uncharacterized protein n=1 Tax=Cyprideis torosa TaxID=163714 RepID=A0A7R8WCX5_9CRUS|nr:unnamed protein product [Cyprideis torosa]CAG0893916.1 unnamed protein product [Cyprideis torosa]
MRRTLEELDEVERTGFKLELRDPAGAYAEDPFQRINLFKLYMLFGFFTVCLTAGAIIASYTAFLQEQYYMYYSEQEFLDTGTMQFPPKPETHGKTDKSQDE